MRWWWLWALLPSVALAHGGTPGGVRPFLEDGHLTGGELSYGLLTLDPAGVPRVTLDPALTVLTEPQGLLVRWFHRLPAGQVLAGTYGGLYRTGDGGCTWTRLPGALADRSVRALWVDPQDPDHLAVATDHPDGLNDVYETRDGGDTWAARGLGEAGAFLLALEGVAGHLWVSGLTGDEAGVLRVAQGEGAWIPPAVDLSAYRPPRLIGRDAEGVVVALPAGPGEEQLARLSPSGDALTELGRFLGEAPLTAYARFQGRAYAITGDAQLWRAADGGAFVPIDGPSRCLDAELEVGALWGCGRYEDRTHFFRSTDGLAFEAVVPFDAVEPACCPAGTPGAEVDPGVWGALREVGIGPPPGAPTAACDGEEPPASDGGVDGGGGGGTSDGGAPADAGAPGDGAAPAGETDGGGGCAAGPGTVGWAALGLLALGGVLSRSRRSR